MGFNDRALGCLDILCLAVILCCLPDELQASHVIVTTVIVPTTIRVHWPTMHYHVKTIGHIRANQSSLEI